jgi:hypothetical protein
MVHIGDQCGFNPHIMVRWDQFLQTGWTVHAGDKGEDMSKTFPGF